MSIAMTAQFDNLFRKATYGEKRGNNNLKKLELFQFCLFGKGFLP